jgi:hypothetical protein
MSTELSLFQVDRIHTPQFQLCVEFEVLSTEIVKCCIFRDVRRVVRLKSSYVSEEDSASKCKVEVELSSETLFSSNRLHTSYLRRQSPSIAIKLSAKARGLSPRANYTDRATAACRRS